MMDETTEYTYDVYLRDTRNGNTDEYHHDFPVKLEVCKFYYTDGNGSCDCNRSIFLYGLGDDTEDMLLECNSGDNVIVIDKIIVRETGEVFLENI